MTTTSQRRATRVVFLVNRAPAVDRQVDLPDGLVVTTDNSGAVQLTLPSGRYRGVLHLDGAKLPFEFGLAAGLSEVSVRLTHEDGESLDPQVQSAMPSDRYRPLELLGRGAAGSVYRCFDQTLQREVAVKLLDQTIGTSSSERDAFLNEGRALASIDHPNLIDIFDLGFHDGRGFMVVQFVDGPDLDRLLQQEGRLSAGAAAAVGVQLARGLDALHRAGLLHRDVKPSNGLVDRAGVVRLADFGLVRPILDFSDPRSKVFGTPAYMSPEQLQALPLGPASDVYGLGATLYHLATGKLAFGGTNMILSHVTAPPPDPREEVPGMPDELAHAILSMMQKEPSDRLTALDAAALLSEVASRVESPGRGRYQPRLGSSDGTTPAGQSQTRLLTPASSAALTPLKQATNTRDVELAAAGKRKAPVWLAAAAVALGVGAIYGATQFGDPVAPQNVESLTPTEEATAIVEPEAPPLAPVAPAVVAPSEPSVAPTTSAAADAVQRAAVAAEQALSATSTQDEETNGAGSADTPPSDRSRQPGRHSAERDRSSRSPERVDTSNDSRQAAAEAPGEAEAQADPTAPDQPAERGAQIATPPEAQTPDEAAAGRAAVDAPETREPPPPQPAAAPSEPTPVPEVASPTPAVAAPPAATIEAQQPSERSDEEESEERPRRGRGTAPPLGF